MKQHLNFQDMFFKKLRNGKIPAVIHVMNGYQINNALITAYDNFTVLIETGERQMLIYKHAISSITPLTNLDFKQEENADECR